MLTVSARVRVANARNEFLLSLAPRARRFGTELLRRFSWLLIGLLAACRDASVPTAPRVSSAWLTGNAAEALGPDGRLRISVIQRHPATEVTVGQATQIATLWTHVYGPWLRAMFENDRGASVDPTNVSQCGRVFYADTPYQDLAATASHGLQTVYGPWWLVTLCDRTGPAISIGVSAYSTNLRIVNGIVTGIGNEIKPSGVPLTLASVPMSPEEAVQIAANETGAKISEVPTLVMGPGESPQTAKWLVTLDRSITVKGTRSGVTRSVTTLLVGFERSWHTKAIQANSPGAPPSFMTADVAAAAGAPKLEVTPRPGFALAIEPVKVIKP